MKINDNWRVHLFYFIFIIKLFILPVSMKFLENSSLHLIVYQIETRARKDEGTLHASKYLRDVNESAERAPVIPES